MSLEESQELKQILDDVILDNIVQVDYNQEALKKNFTSIIDYLRKLHMGQKKLIQVQQESDDKINSLQNDNNSLKNNITQVQNDNKDLQEQIEKLKKEQENLRQEQIGQQKELTAHDDGIKLNAQEIQNLKDRIGQLENRILNLESNQGGDIKIDPSQFQNQSNFDENSLINKLNGQFVTKQEYDQQIKEILDELEKLKQQIKQIQSSLPSGSQGNENLDSDRLKELENKINDKLSNFNFNNVQQNDGNSNNSQLSLQVEQMQKELDDLRDLLRKKVDTDRFEREIASLRKLINQLSNIGDGKNVEISQGMSEEDRQYVDKLREQLENLEEELRKLKKEVEGNKQEYSSNKKTTDSRLDALENASKFKNNSDDLNDILNKLSQIQNDLAITTELAKENESNIRNLKRNYQNNQNLIYDNQNTNNNNTNDKGGDGISEELVDEKIRQCKEELLELIKALRDEKVPFDDLWKSEAVILEKVDEVAGALIKKLADKSDTKKALIYIERKINQMYHMINKGMGGNENDGLLVKRPMLWSCISCDKSLDKYGGKMGDYKNWAVFPPKETTPDRMGRFGKGYKSLLERSKIKEQRLREEAMRMAQQQQMNDYQQGGNFLPNVHQKNSSSAQFNQTSQGFNQNQGNQNNGQMSQDV